MVTIQELILEKIREHPFLKELICEGLINLSAFARKIKPEIEKKLFKPISTSAVIMSTKRVADKIKNCKKDPLKEKNLFDITVKLNISEYTFKRTETLLQKHERLLSLTKNSELGFFAFTYGIFEMTVLISTKFEDLMLDIFKGEKLTSKIGDLSALILKLPKNAYSSPGIYFNILRQLAWENINIVEVVSTLNEFSIIINDKEIDRAFSILKKHILLS